VARTVADGLSGFKKLKDNKQKGYNMNSDSKSPLLRVGTAIRTLAPDSSYHSDGAKVKEDNPKPE